MQKTAIFWIRDGVLVDRMHVNPVAFAVAALRFAEPQLAAQVGLTRLVNFGFEASGISCADKMKKFNREHFALVADIDAAAGYYNALAADAGASCSYFLGICDLVASLKALGAMHFITSAVEQSVLDAWAESQQGRILSNNITEILGQRPNFSKGKDHFAYVRERYGVEKIFYVADATPEIRAGAEYSKLFNITPVGFAHAISAQKVRQAYDLVMDSHEKHAGNDGARENFRLIEAGLALPEKANLTATLKNAGAASVVSGEAERIVADLRRYFEVCELS